MRSGVITAAIVLAACLVPEHAPAATLATPAGVVSQLPPVGPYPDDECTRENSPGIYIGPTGMLWECICEERQYVAPDPDDCAWYDQGLVSRSRAAKLVRKAQVRLRVTRLPRMVVIHLAR